MAGKRSDMPRLSRLMEYWREHYIEIFPNLAARWIGWGEPFCFRCGWLAPVDDTVPSLVAAWDSAGGWLERGHLQDLAFGGPNVPENLVPLCRACHDVMPEFEDRMDAVAFVANGPAKNGWWQLFTDTVFAFGSLNPPYKTRLLRQLYLRFMETERLVTAAVNGDEGSAVILRDRFPEVKPVMRQYGSEC